MYGNVKEAGDSQLAVLEFGVPIPHKLLETERHMKQIRGMFRFNPDMPGALELVHPNKFLPNLRPVEDFQRRECRTLSVIDHRDAQIFKRLI